MISFFMKRASLVTWVALATATAAGCAVSAPETASDPVVGTDQSAITVDPLPPGGVGAPCGGIAARTCRPNLYCQFPATARCGQADQGGTCQVRPTICTDQVDPVCGCNGVTYPNACEAASAGTSVGPENLCRPTCDFETVPAPTLAETVGTWSRHTVDGWLVTDETLAITAGGKYTLVETKGPNCTVGQACPAIAIRRLEAHGSVSFGTAPGIVLGPEGNSSTLLPTKLELERNCAKASRITTFEDGAEVILTPKRPICPVESPICRRCREEPATPVCATLQCVPIPPECL
jgi:hypothetical protein